MSKDDLDDRVREVLGLALRSFDAQDIEDRTDMPITWIRNTLKDLVRWGELEEEPDGHYRAPRLRAGVGLGPGDHGVKRTEHGEAC